MEGRVEVEQIICAFAKKRIYVGDKVDNDSS